jgi:hypothetical protein
VSLGLDPGHWQQRAEEMRSAAKDMTDAETKETLLKIAQDYDRLAERAFARLTNPADH